MKLSPQELWLDFARRMKLNDKQVKQFQTFYDVLVATNELFNLTALTDLRACMAYHFEDSLAAEHYFDFSKLSCVADIGTGGGFPGIPLKIKYPHLELMLIEVSHKKVQFLQELSDTLKLDAVEVVTYDWRTFLRKTSYKIDLFCARASLQPEELIRMFKPASPYKDSQLLYWASQLWQPDSAVVPFVRQDYAYTIRNKERRLVLLNRSTESGND